MTPYGFTEDTLTIILDIVKSFPQVEALLLYGSRARGDFYDGSDIDLAIKAPSMETSEFAQLWEKLNALPVVYKFDILHYEQLKNEKLLETIKQDGVVLYSSQS